MNKKTIDTEVIFEKPLLKGNKSKNKKLNLLVKIKAKNKTEKRRPLNISYVIDTSGSMNGLLNVNDFFNQQINSNVSDRTKNSVLGVPPGYGSSTINTQQLSWPSIPTPSTPFSPSVPPQDIFNNNQRCIQTAPVFKNQLMLVKEAVIESLNYLKEDDVISIISFDSDSKILAEGLTIKDKSKIISIVNSLVASGSTNLLAGWKDGVKCITNNMKKDSLNRVILLTDGQVNAYGNDNIPDKVKTINKAGISTSAFGVGLHYNEDLLMGIANSGDGNYYYIKETKDFKNLFTDEFVNINKIIARNVKLLIDDKEINLLNNFISDNNQFDLPNLVEDKTIELLLTFSLKFNKSTVEELTSKKITIIYQDRDSNECKETIMIKIPVVDKDNKFTNKEVKEKIILNEVARNKNKIAESIDNNDFEKVSDLLNKSKMFASNLSGQLQASALNSLSAMETSMQNKDFNMLRKTSLYESYNSTRSKER